ncbi:MAG TPA: hypothetical protein PKA19_16445, partial [Bacillota bacterium]|nr:hypothetical protein [Bacillota bacterium]
FFVVIGLVSLARHGRDLVRVVGAAGAVGLTIAGLHSMGQFLQDGSQIFFETVLNVINPPEDLTVPESAGELLAGRSMNDINQAAVEGVIAAHEATGVPIVKLDILELSPHCFGQMVYFFETACALSGYLNGVDPFDQPGVESYKSEMRKVLQAK